MQAGMPFVKPIWRRTEEGLDDVWPLMDPSLYTFSAPPKDNAIRHDRGHDAFVVEARNLCWANIMFRFLPFCRANIANRCGIHVGTTVFGANGDFAITRIAFS